MGVLIRFLVISVPIVFAVVLFWSTIQEKFLSPARPPVSFPQAELPTGTGENLSLEPVAAKQVDSRAATKTATTIYRWVDANGHVVFSDKPSSENAVKHSPKDIGRMPAAAINYQSETASAEVVRHLLAQTASQPRARLTDFKFTSLNVDQHFRYVLMKGRISGGYGCDKLKVIATAENERGRHIRGGDVISYSGTGSRFYEMKVPARWSGMGNLPNWRTKSVNAYCLD